MLFFSAIFTALAFWGWADKKYTPFAGACFVFCFVMSMGLAFKGI